jgi:hypothetical protein
VALATGKNKKQRQDKVESRWAHRVRADEHIGLGVLYFLAAAV